MNFVELFIRRPVMTTLVMTAILLFGTLAYQKLPVSDLPTVDFPTILVSARLPGASPETMASSVATVLERQFSTIAGVDSMNSVSAQGNTQVTLQFNLERDIDAAAQDVQAAIAKAGTQLPEGMPSPPSYQKVNPADQAILYMSLASDTLPLSTVNEYADTYVAQRLSMINGVAQVQLFGSQKFAVRAQMDPRELSSRGIGMDEVSTAIQRGNVNMPTGTLDGAHQSYIVKANGQLLKAADYRPLIVAYRNGAPVRLGELGRVIDDVEDNRVASWSRDIRGIILAVQRQPGVNTVEVADAIQRLMPAMRAQLPPSIKFELLFDRSETIRQSVKDVKFTLAATIVLVILVIFVFLRNVSATIIPSLALPMSIVGTFAVMHALGYSLDNLSLMALTLSVGFVVDDAIVMLENIVRHMEKGESPYEASVKGAKEISFTIISMTVSLAAVFLPVLFLGGIIGRLFHEFAVTISSAILVSGFVSLTLTPMLCSRFLRPSRAKRHSALYAMTEWFFNALLRMYDWTLRLAIRFSFLTLLVALALLIGTIHLYRVIPKGFIPSEDTNQMFAMTEVEQGASFESLADRQKIVAKIIGDDPNVLTLSSSVGAMGSSVSSSSGRMFIHLKHRPGRKLHVDGVINGLRGKLAAIPGIRVFLQNPPTIRLGGYLTKALYQFTMQSPDMDELYHSAPILEEKLRGLPLLQDVSSDLLVRNPQARVVIDKDKASALGVSSHQIEDTLANAFGARQISTIYDQNNQYKVILELLPEYQSEPSTLPLLYVRSDSGKLVPLGSIARIEKKVGPQTINHLGQLPAVTISFNLKPGVSLGEAVAAVKKTSLEVLPATISTSFQGTAQAFQSSLTGLGVLLILSILVIYIVLGILYESFIHPLTILSGLPSAGFGALLTLILFKTDLNIYAFVGVIMLVGIVKKNAIMMIDFALEAQRREGKSAREAIYEGCLVRFRPIMMTTMAALVGSLPIAMGYGAGAESRQPLGLAVVGGLAVSQILTLYLTPVVYIYLDAMQRFAGRLFRRRPTATELLPKSVPDPAHPATGVPQGS